MGCDIHAAIEFRKDADSPWQAVLTKNRLFGKYTDELETTARLDISRDYDLFAVLGNVRNGTSAGCDTGDAFAPMSDNRGVPKDISPEARAVLSNEHSATWVTLADILAYDWDRSTKHRGWVNATEFAEWDQMKEWRAAPNSYCGDGNFKRVSIEEMRLLVHVATRGSYPDSQAERLLAIGHTMCLLEWDETYTESTTQMWTVILPKMLKHSHLHGNENVRLVMDFDS